MGKTASRKHAEPSDVKLPTELELLRFDLVKACTDSEDPKDWPETEPPTKFLRAYGPEAIARILIKAYHVTVRKAAIAFLWKKQLSEGPTRVKLGHAAKAPAQLQFLAEVDFVLVFNHAAWQVLKAEQKIALVDHELAHCDIDSDSGLPALVPHDVEEFGAIVRRWGLWKPDLMSFGDCVKAALQLDLWETPAPPRATDVTPLRQHE